jgi:hypothetical protein
MTCVKVLGVRHRQVPSLRRRLLECSATRWSVLRIAQAD